MCVLHFVDFKYVIVDFVIVFFIFVLGTMAISSSRACMQLPVFFQVAGCAVDGWLHLFLLVQRNGFKIVGKHNIKY